MRMQKPVDDVGKSGSESSCGECNRRVAAAFTALKGVMIPEKMEESCEPGG